MIIFVTGGVRSGKSTYAMRRALDLTAEPVYIATAKIWDEDFQKRVQRHQDERGPEWTTFEAYRDVHSLPLQGKVVVIDCVTLWLTNFFMDRDNDIDLSLADFKREIDGLMQLDATFIVISNELGMGMHADTEVGRKFADLQGWANQFVAGKAAEAVFMVAGLPLFLKK
jgi:adenosylcobinamide kinase/adenosylcobinamide-phosphate guanylyltransferase